ncbi:lipocalin-like domain-containing protein [Sphingomonas sp.]|uniref:lipocalin-like domain-containing protein n=1 Tax=Sphingomonas sp. TaxID=28214 RepID=UPI003D6D4509
MFKLMPPPRTIEVAAAAVLATASLFAFGQPTTARATVPPRELVGSWTLVAADVRHPDGSIGRDYGEAPKGSLMIDARGRYALLIYKSERPKFASGDKAKGTPEEYRDTVLGMSTHFGTVAVDAATKTLTFTIDQASFSNWNGAKQQRHYELKRGELSYTVEARPNGDVPISIWRRIA